MSQYPRFLALFVLLSCLVACQSEDGPKVPDGVTLELINPLTNLPLSDVSIQLLENGPIHVSETSGRINFPLSELVGSEIIQGTETIYAFSAHHPDFRPMEFNLTEGISQLTMIPDSIGFYGYHTPVQLADDLTTSSYSSIGLDSVLMEGLQAKIANQKYRDLHSLLIYKDDRLVFEEYYFGNNDTIQFENGVIRDRTPEPIWWSRNEKHYIASANKALTSIFTGIALDQYGLGTDALLKDYLPEYAPYFENGNKALLSFHHALNMVLGFTWDEWGSNDLVLLWQADDFGDFLLSRTNIGPGRTWIYNSASPNLILRALSNMTGENIRTWADEHFYGKLGITDYKWQSQTGGVYPEGAARMYMKPRDLLKIGITLLDDGKWQGEQVIPSAWIEKCMTIQQRPDAGNYSHFFWVRELNGIEYLCAEGDGGNYINVFPDQNMVIVITQGNYLAWPLYVNQANDLMGKFILPAIQ